ncbi:MAG: chromate transporter [Lachnospiraceae bacterium]|nr:chromate transporter [Lachnospiraceae bacterium]
MKELLQLYCAFFRIGLFTFGGGYAMLPMLQKEVVEKHGWATEEELMDYYAIGQCTPGVIAVNTGTFIGSKNRGTAGAAAATLGVITPSLIIITLIAAFFTNFKSNEIVAHAFAGIRVAVTVLVGTSVWKIGKKSLLDLPTCLIAAAVLALNLLTDLSPVILVVASAAAGIFLKWKEGRDAK